MPELEVQRFLKNKTFGDLQREWGVYARVNNSCYKFSLNYNALEFTPGHYGTEQCRGTVLAVPFGHGPIPCANSRPDPTFCPGETIVLAYPFDKFYNSHELHASINWNDTDLVVEDKMDGTLCIMYWDGSSRRWCVATRSVPDADLPIDGSPALTFRKLFELAIQEQFTQPFDTWSQRFSKSFTWCFELTSPQNRVFVDYKSPRVTLLGVRDNLSFAELDPDRVVWEMGIGIPRPRRWSLRTPEEIKEFVATMPPEKCEGAVAVDSTFKRVKVKNPQWVTANATKTVLSTSPRNLMRYVLSGMSDDITSMMPQNIQDDLTRIQKGVKRVTDSIDAKYAEYRVESGNDRKLFAQIVKAHHAWSTPFFKMFEGKFVTSLEFIADVVKNDKLGEPLVDTLLALVNEEP